ncbi:MAG TPA: hypothetical protein VIF10_10550 [Methylobacter sp.]|jgi:hypothetical protein
MNNYVFDHGDFDPEYESSIMWNTIEGDFFEQAAETPGPEGVFVGRIEPKIKNTVPTQEAYPDTIPYCRQDSRAVPRIFLRSSLFTATESENKIRYAETQLAVWGNDPDKANKKLMFYSGQRLDQYDLATWQSIMYLAGGREIGQPFRVSASDILRVLNKSDGGNNIRRLHNQLLRLNDTAVTIIDGSKEISYAAYMSDIAGLDKITGKSYEEYQLSKQTVFCGSLIESLDHDSKTKKYWVTISKSMKSLCENFTYLDASVLKTLSHRPLALWLYGYFSSHKDSSNFAYTLEKLSWLSGYSEQWLNANNETDQVKLKSFKRTLKANLDELEKATANGEKFCYDHARFNKNALVCITKSKPVSKKKAS